MEACISSAWTQQWSQSLHFDEAQSVSKRALAA
jgi:hypothetical protein